MKNNKWKIVLVIIVVGLAVYAAYPLEKKINLGLDLQGGMHLVLKVDTSGLSPDLKKDAPEQALEVLRNRIDEFGVREPRIQRQGKDEIIIQLPGISDRNRALDIIGKTALLEFKLVSSDIELLKKAIDGDVARGYELKYLNQEPLIVSEKALLTGSALVNAFVNFESQFNVPTVHLKFDSKGTRRFANITAAHVGERLAIVLDGNVQSAPRINEKIPSGEAVISGRFSQQEAQDLAMILRAGALPAPITIEEERTVGPTLGKDSIEHGMRAIIIGGILVVSFIGVYYLLAGLIANFTLAINLVLILGALSYFKATLTLPGIAGIVLTLGIAIDANVLIFERIREELRIGRSVRSSIVAGYRKAFVTILDSNVTTLIVAIILFQFGSGPIRGFATTLSLGIIASLFTAFFVSRTIFDLLTSKFKLNRLVMLKIIRQPKINFTSHRKISYFISLLVIIIGLSFFLARGSKNLGIDFSGGTVQEYRFEQPVKVDRVRGLLDKIGLGSSSIIQEVRGTNDIIIRTYVQTPDDITKELKEHFTENPFEILRVEQVGPEIGKSLRARALLAFLYSLVGICIYISMRFKFKFAIAAIVALFHDILVTVGFLSLTGREFSLPVVAALLTIVGYSINDTIVIFDRIRENLKLSPKAKYAEVVNLSLNQTLSRTIITSLTTLLAVFALYLWGGVVINDFAFTLLVGVIVGTYSSIFVAAPILVDWHK